MSNISFNYHVDDTILTRVQTRTKLGIFQDSNLRCEYEIGILCDATQILGFVYWHYKFFKNVDTLKSLYCSLVRSRLRYVSTVCSLIYSKYIDTREQVQRKFLKYLVLKEDGIYLERILNNNLLFEQFKYNSLQ